MNKMLVINLKANFTLPQAKEYVLKVKDLLPSYLEVVICPSFLWLPFFMGKFPFKLGSQDISFLPITGDITGEMLKSCAVSYTLVGHGERRRYYPNEDISSKVKEAIDYNIIPIICLGETKEERLRHKTADVLYYQIKNSLKKIEVLDDLVFAYEPCWAIGTGTTLNLEEIDETARFIKNVVYQEHKANVRVLYGGSIRNTNVKKIYELESLDGILIGKSASDAVTLENIFAELVK